MKSAVSIPDEVFEKVERHVRQRRPVVRALDADVNSKPNALLDVAFGLVLATLLLGALQDGFKTGPIEEGSAAVCLGMYLQAWGLLFIASYFRPGASYLLKRLMWICENWSHPRGRWTAVLWGVVAIGMGTMPLLQGLGLTHL